MVQNIKYDEEFQKYLISVMISDPPSFLQSQNIIKAEYFDSKLQPVVNHILSYASEYHSLPLPEQINAITGVHIDKYDTITPDVSRFYLDEIEPFCRCKALELIVLDGPDLLAQGKGGEIENRVKTAMTISLIRDLGVSYFEDPLTRLQRMHERADFKSTGWRTLDDKLYGGFTDGALNIFLGNSGAGKSLILQNIALNWALNGLHVVYFTLELSEDLVAQRIDAMTTGFSTKEIFTRMNEVSIAIRNVGRASGSLIIKKMPSAGTTSNDLRAYLKEYEIQRGHKPNGIITDYLDLVMPNNARVDPGNLWVKDKFVSEEMRALGEEWGCLHATASQMTRGSLETQDFDQSHVAGGISKINTADNVMAILATAAMKEKGEMELQFLKTRSSSAVGQKIKLRFQTDCLRISDIDADIVTGRMSPKQTREMLKAGGNDSHDVPNMQNVDVPQDGSIAQSILAKIVKKN